MMVVVRMMLTMMVSVLVMVMVKVVYQSIYQASAWGQFESLRALGHKVLRRLLGVRAVWTL